SGDAANDYDEIKPTGGDGGVIIVPHFQVSDRSTLVKYVDGRLVTLADEEALAAMQGFQQNPGIVEQILATTVEKKSRRSQSTASKKLAGAATAGGLRARARELSADESERDWELLQWV